MTTIYFMTFVAWVILGIVYFFIRKQSRIIKKSKENHATYITGKIYLKLHDDMVISSLYKGDKLICDNVLEYSDGLIKTTFTTIFGTIELNRITKKFVINENKNIDKK